MADVDNNFVKLLRATLGPVQELENAAQQVLINRTLDNSIGHQLDVLGKIVKQPRNGTDDDTYRRYIRARISVHNSNGTISDVLKVSGLIIFDDAAVYYLHDVGPAAFALEVNGIVVDALAPVLIAFLRPTASAGVRPIVETSAFADSLMFGFDDTGEGWGDALTPSTGGHMSSAMD